MSMPAKWNKYAAVGRITIRSQLAYLGDFFMRTIFLVLILYIFMQLWRVTFDSEGTERIAGYTFEQIIWYLIVAESVVLSTPKLIALVEAEVKNGDIAYRLIRPVHYVGYHYAGFMGEAAVRLAVNLGVGSLLGIIAFGWSTPSGTHLAALAVVLIGSFTVQFGLSMAIALCAFWVEETRGLEFVYNKILFTIGGMLLPVELFPGVLQTISGWLPFQAVTYFSAKTAVRFAAGEWLRMLGTQAVWIALLAAGVSVIYKKGVKKLHVNGG